MQLNSWGMYPQIKSKKFTFKTKDNLKDILKENSTFILFGKGRSYEVFKWKVSKYFKTINPSLKFADGFVAVIQTYIISVGFTNYIFSSIGFALYPE